MPRAFCNRGNAGAKGLKHRRPELLDPTAQQPRHVPTEPAAAATHTHRDADPGVGEVNVLVLQLVALIAHVRVQVLEQGGRGGMSCCRTSRGSGGTVPLRALTLNTLGSCVLSMGYALMVAAQSSPYSALLGLSSWSGCARLNTSVQYSCLSWGAAQGAGGAAGVRGVRVWGQPLVQPRENHLLPPPVTQGPWRTSLAYFPLSVLARTVRSRLEARR